MNGDFLFNKIPQFVLASDYPILQVEYPKSYAVNFCYLRRANEAKYLMIANKQYQPHYLLLSDIFNTISFFLSFNYIHLKPRIKKEGGKEKYDNDSTSAKSK